jgi:hypothetical protein
LAHRTCRRCWKADSDRPAATFDATVEYLDRTETVVIATPLRAGGEACTWIWAATVDGVPDIPQYRSMGPRPAMIASRPGV